MSYLMNMQQTVWLDEELRRKIPLLHRADTSHLVILYPRGLAYALAQINLVEMEWMHDLLWHVIDLEF